MRAFSAEPIAANKDYFSGPQAPSALSRALNSRLRVSISLPRAPISPRRAAVSLGEPAISTPPGRGSRHRLRHSSRPPVTSRRQMSASLRRDAQSRRELPALEPGRPGGRPRDPPGNHRLAEGRSEVSCSGRGAFPSALRVAAAASRSPAVSLHERGRSDTPVRESPAGRFLRIVQCHGSFRAPGRAPHFGGTHLPRARPKPIQHARSLSDLSFRGYAVRKVRRLHPPPFLFPPVGRNSRPTPSLPANQRAGFGQSPFRLSSREFGILERRCRRGSDSLAPRPALFVRRLTCPSHSASLPTRYLSLR